MLTMLPPLSPKCLILKCGQDRTQHVDVVMPVKYILGCFGKRSGPEYACVIHQNVWCAECLLRLRKQAGDVVSLRNIALNSNCLAPRRKNLVDNFPGCGL